MERRLQVLSGSPADMSKIKKSGRQRSSASLASSTARSAGRCGACCALLSGSLPSSARLWAEVGTQFSAIKGEAPLVELVAAGAGRWAGLRIWWDAVIQAVVPGLPG